MTDLSIILSVKDRPIALHHTLQSWSNLECNSYEFIMVDDGSKSDDKFPTIAREVYSWFPDFQYIRLKNGKYRLPNIAWNTGLEASTGDFLIFAMGDIIISHKDIWRHIQDCYVGNRVSLFTCFLSPVITQYLQLAEWQSDPTILETAREFWDWQSEEGENNRYRIQHIEHMVARTNYVSGCAREDWKWLGGLRNADDSELLGDNDLFYREQLLGIPATPIPVVRGYHQWHPKIFKSSGYSYRYETEEQARLLEEAEKV